MLVTFIDDSGSDQQGPVFVLAGYVAPVPVWESFSEAWGQCLDSEPRLEYFKMKEAHRIHDAFHGWSPEDRDKKLTELVDIIRKQPVISALVLAVRWDDFRRARSEFPDIKDCYPYDMLFHGVLWTVTRLLLEYRIAETVGFVFDEQGSMGERAILTYKRIRAALPDAQSGMIIGSPRLEDDKVVVPLQAADLLAWQIRRYMAEQGNLPIEIDTVNDGTWRIARMGRVSLAPGYPVLQKLLVHESIFRVFSYESIRLMHEWWNKPLSEIRQAVDWRDEP